MIGGARPRKQQGIYSNKSSVGNWKLIFVMLQMDSLEELCLKKLVSLTKPLGKLPFHLTDDIYSRRKQIVIDQIAAELYVVRMIINGMYWFTSWEIVKQKSHCQFRFTHTNGVGSMSVPKIITKILRTQSGMLYNYDGTTMTSWVGGICYST